MKLIGIALGLLALNSVAVGLGNDIKKEYALQRVGERMMIDIPFTNDLTTAAGIEFEMNCTTFNNVRGFSCYLQSGNGWYHTIFSVEEEKTWEKLRLNKRDFKREGQPDAWSKVNTLRIAAWANGTNSIPMKVRNITSFAAHNDILIVTGNDTYYSKIMASTLEQIGLGAVSISQDDLTAEIMARFSIVAFPYNPDFPLKKMQMVADYHQRGGKLLVAYSAPKPLLEMAGVDIQDFMSPMKNGQPPLLGFNAMHNLKSPILETLPNFTPQNSWCTAQVKTREGAKVAATWEQQNVKEQLPALVMTSNSVYLAHVWLGGTDDVHQKFIQSLVCYLAPKLKSQIEAKANDMCRKRQRAEKNVATIKAWEKPEFRAFWCHDPYGLGGTNNWDTTAALLKKNGFTAVFANLAWAGTAFYRSQVLPVSPQVATRGDALQQFLAACRKHGLEAHVWKVCWNLGDMSDKNFATAAMRADRLQRSGKTNKINMKWLCPAKEENRKLEIDAAVEIARSGVDGVHLDYIRYPDSAHCNCNGCSGNRAELITETVREISKAIRTATPKVKLSAAVFGNVDGTKTSIGQDWATWCKEGLVDFVCPMNYTLSHHIFKNMCLRQMEVCKGCKAKIYPGIGMSCAWQDTGNDAELVSRQIIAARLAGCEGWTIFNLDRRAERVLPILATGPTK